MIYKITFNIPGDEFPTEVAVNKEQMERFYEALSKKTKIVKIENCYFNTAYFVRAIPDTEKIVQSNYTKLPEPQITEEERQENRRRFAEMKKKLFNK